MATPPHTTTPLYLSLFGSIALRARDGRELDAVLRSPKRLALLAHLAAARPSGFQRRDKIVGTFWPESTEQHARQALRQALYVLRNELGENAIRTRGDSEIAVDHEIVGCDVVEFRRALVEERYEAALELYRGDFLEGFFVSDARNLDTWIEQERARLRREATQAALALAEHEYSQDDAPSAARWARRATELSPDDENALRRLVELLRDAGDRVGAMKAYDDFARSWKERLGITPSAETVALIETIAAEQRQASVTAGAQVDTADRPTTETVRPTDRERRRVSTLATVIVAAVTLAGVIAARLIPTDPSLDPNVIAVMPFRVISPDPTLDYLREGMLDHMHVYLTGYGVPRAIDPRTLLAAWNRKVAGPNEDLSVDASVDLARSLGAGKLLLGEVRTVSDGVALSGHILQVADASVEAEVHVTGRPEPLEQFAIALLSELAHVEPSQTATLSDSLEAVKAYLTGESILRTGDGPEAVEYYRRAVDIDSTFALAWSSIAMAGLGQHRAEARQAWAMRDRLSERDRLELQTYFHVGPKFPAPHTFREWVGAAEAYVAAAPDRPEAWTTLARIISGTRSHWPNWKDRARMALDTAIALDSTFKPATAERLDLAVEMRDVEAIDRFAQKFFAGAPDLPFGDCQRWRVAHARNDATALAELRRRFAEFSNTCVYMMPGISIQAGMPSDDAILATTTKERGVQPTGWRINFAASRAAIAMVQGRVQEAVALMDSLAQVVPQSIPRLKHFPVEAAALIVTQSLLDPDYEVATADAAQTLWRFAEPEEPPETSNDSLAQADALCFSQILRTARGDSSGTRAAISQIPRLVNGRWSNVFQVGAHGVCPSTLAAMLERMNPPPDGTPALDHLDSLMTQGPGLEYPYNFAYYLVARLQEEQGDPQRALAALRRRGTLPYVRFFALTVVPAFLREEGRLAAMVGDTVGAVSAYRHYLTLRTDPGSDGMREEVERVKAELAKLTQGRRSQPTRGR